MIIDLSPLLDCFLFLLRLVVAIIFISSGWSHAKNSRQRSEQIGLSQTATFLLGVAELLGAFSVALGIYIQMGALLLIFVMLGAIGKKMFVWNTGFYSDEGFGWHYDLLLLCINLVFLVETGRWGCFPNNTAEPPSLCKVKF